jgi:GNAT superfamily N-acetyltransferase
VTLGSLDDLPQPCRACVFWEVPGARRGPDPRRPQAGRAAKEAWWRVTELEWGTPGKAVYEGEALIAYAVLAPAIHLPRTRELGRGPSDDALILATLWVDPGHRGNGVGKLLIQAMVRETHRRGGRALEAYGVRHPDVRPAPSCIVPEGFLLACGFAVVQEHATYPLLRLDLRQLARWQESVGHALEGVLSALARRERARIPARPALQSAAIRSPRRSPR